MSVWQVDFAIVPRRAFAKSPRVAVQKLLDTDWWSAERFPSGFSHQLAAIAPAGSSSTPERQTWGEEDGNRIDVWFENGRATRQSNEKNALSLRSPFRPRSCPLRLRGLAVIGWAVRPWMRVLSCTPPGTVK